MPDLLYSTVAAVAYALMEELYDQTFIHPDPILADQMVLDHSAHGLLNGNNLPGFRAFEDRMMTKGLPGEVDPLQSMLTPMPSVSSPSGMSTTDYRFDPSS